MYRHPLRAAVKTMVYKISIGYGANVCCASSISSLLRSELTFSFSWYVIFHRNSGIHAYRHNINILRALLCSCIASPPFRITYEWHFMCNYTVITYELSYSQAEHMQYHAPRWVPPRGHAQADVRNAHNTTLVMWVRIWVTLYSSIYGIFLHKMRRLQILFIFISVK